ncbi:MAG: GH92 family glycosyl hydrolase [Bacteroidota bacterium]
MIKEFYVNAFVFLNRSSKITIRLCIILVVFSASICKGQKTYVDYVDPLIESAKSRYFFFNSACRPFGMVNLSPDNILEGEGSSGYRFDEPYIRGFTHIHDWGAGGLLIMPTNGNVDPSQGPENWKSQFSHKNEIVKPGYHQVYLDKYNIKVELTSTTRVGFHKYTFDRSGDTKIMISLGGQLGSGIMKDAYIKRISDTELEGWVNEQSFVGKIKLFFVIQLDKPFRQLIGWKRESIKGKVKDTIGGEQLGVYADYNMLKGQTLEVKAGLSWCGIDQARLNLNTELNHWDFERVVHESKNEWNKWLGRIEVKGGTENQKIKFYTDLWRSLLGRRQIQDVNGKYPNYMSGSLAVNQLPLDSLGKPKFMHLSTDALWLTMWDLNILWGAAYPEVLESFVNSSMVYYKDGGNLPRGPVIGKESWIMTSSPVSELIVGAHMLGIKGIDNMEDIYKALKKAHMPGGTMDRGNGFVQKYIDLGFVPETKPSQGWGGAGRVMEYVTQDWALAQLAKTLGKEEDFKYFMKRSTYWTNMFDPSIGFIRPKNEDGTWTEPFDPLLNANFGGFVESNTWQTTFMAVHDVNGLVNLLGGTGSYSKKLNFAFEKAKADNFVGGYGNNYVNYSNQPGLEMAHLFNYIGHPWLSQYWVRQVYNKTFSGTTPYSGYGGNDEDQGQMGSLSVLMSIGLFDIKGGCDIKPIYQITSPIFDTVVIHLNNKYYKGEKFIITTRHNSPANMYIQSARLNNRKLDQCWFYQDDFTKGGELDLVLGPLPNKKWGIKNLPPSETISKPSFEFSNFTYPKKVNAGEIIEVSYDVQNSGSLGTYFGKLLLDAKQVAHKELIFKESEKQKVVYNVQFFTNGTHYIIGPDNKKHAVNIFYKKSKLQYLATDISHSGEIISVKTTLYNDGSDIINKPLEIKINNKIARKEATILKPGEKKDIVFTCQAPYSGSYKININKEIQKYLTVEKPVEKPENGLVLFYDFTNSKTPLLDLSGRKNYPAPIEANPQQSIEKGIKFEKNFFVKLSSNKSINTRGGIAISIVFNVERWNGASRIVQKGRDDNQFLIYRSGDELEFQLAGVQNGRLSIKLPQLNKWVYLVCQYDKNESKLQAWLNGKLVEERKATGNINLTPDPMYIGGKNEQAVPGDNFDGYLKEFKIYNRPLSPSEIEKTYSLSSVHNKLGED